jgi:hypothetical protein
MTPGDKAADNTRSSKRCGAAVNGRFMQVEDTVAMRTLAQKEEQLFDLLWRGEPGKVPPAQGVMTHVVRMQGIEL